MSAYKLAIFLLLFPAATVWCQSQTGETNPLRGLEVFGGYSYLLSPSNLSDLPSGSGFNVGAGVPIGGSASLIGKFSLFPISCNCPSASRPNEKTFLFGPRFSLPSFQSSRFSPFVAFLVGGSTYSNSNSLRDGYEYNNNSSVAYEIEGGLDYRLTPHLAVRGAGGYVHSTLAPDRSLIGYVSTGYGRGQFDVDLVYRF